MQLPSVLLARTDQYAQSKRPERSGALLQGAPATSADPSAGAASSRPGTPVIDRHKGDRSPVQTLQISPGGKSFRGGERTPLTKMSPGSALVADPRQPGKNLARVPSFTSDAGQPRMLSRGMRSSNRDLAGMAALEAAKRSLRFGDGKIVSTRADKPAPKVPAAAATTTTTTTSTTTIATVGKTLSPSIEVSNIACAVAPDIVVTEPDLADAGGRVAGGGAKVGRKAGRNRRQAREPANTARCKPKGETQRMVMPRPPRELIRVNNDDAPRRLEKHVRRQDDGATSRSRKTRAPNLMLPSALAAGFRQGRLTRAEVKMLLAHCELDRARMLNQNELFTRDYTFAINKYGMQKSREKRDARRYREIGVGNDGRASGQAVAYGNPHPSVTAWWILDAIVEMRPLPPPAVRQRHMDDTAVYTDFQFVAYCCAFSIKPGTAVFERLAHTVNFLMAQRPIDDQRFFYFLTEYHLAVFHKLIVAEMRMTYLSGLCMPAVIEGLRKDGLKAHEVPGFVMHVTHSLTGDERVEPGMFNKMLADFHRLRRYGLEFASPDPEIGEAELVTEVLRQFCKASGGFARADPVSGHGSRAAAKAGGARPQVGYGNRLPGPVRDWANIAKAPPPLSRRFRPNSDDIPEPSLPPYGRSPEMGAFKQLVGHDTVDPRDAPSGAPLAAAGPQDFMTRYLRLRQETFVEMLEENLTRESTADSQPVASERASRRTANQALHDNARRGADHRATAAAKVRKKVRVV